jgi:hypothetical protein
MPYQTYPTHTKYPNYPIHISDYINLNPYNQTISTLALTAIPEPWSYPYQYPYQHPYQKDNIILKNYLSKTFERLCQERKIIHTDQYLTFNTGLFTPNYESIYLLAERNITPYDRREWKFTRFCTEYDFDNTDIYTLPERADYFQDPSLLIFDYHYPIRVQYEHILDHKRNRDRLPPHIADSNMRLQLFKGAVDISINKVIANYKLAVPQYYHNGIQLLIPIFLDNDNYPNLVLVISKQDGYYQGHTCITPEMAYNNARLIAKPENNWLIL